jgi:hypothetical protein
MEGNNAKNRPSQKGKNRAIDIRHSEGVGGILGATKTDGSELRNDEIGIGGEDSKEGDTAINGNFSGHGITGKTISQLINKLQQQLAYHKRETREIEQQIEDLSQFLKDLNDE